MASAANQPIDIALGSTNPLKEVALIRAARWMELPVTIHMHDVASGVPAQPFGTDEIHRGAINRGWYAKVAQFGEDRSAGIGIGIENGIIELDGSVLSGIDIAVIHLVAPKGNVTVTTPGMSLPTGLYVQFKMNREEGQTFGEWLAKRTRDRSDAADPHRFMTNHRLDRQTLLMQGLQLALAQARMRQLIP